MRNSQAINTILTTVPCIEILTNEALFKKSYLLIQNSLTELMGCILDTRINSKGLDTKPTLAWGIQKGGTVLWKVYQFIKDEAHKEWRLLCHSHLWKPETYLTLLHISQMHLLYWSSSLDTHSLGCPWQAFCFQHHCALDLSFIMDKKDHARISKQGQWFPFEPFMCIHCLSPPAV